jgi:hypothetical protein
MRNRKAEGGRRKAEGGRRKAEKKVSGASPAAAKKTAGLIEQET